MWKLGILNSIYRAIRQHVHAPRPSAGIYVEEEKADIDNHKDEKEQRPLDFANAKETDNLDNYEPLLHHLHYSIKKTERQNGWAFGKTVNPGKDEGDGWWRSCHYDFRRMCDGSHRLFEAISFTLGSAVLWGTDTDRHKRKARLLYRVLFTVPNTNSPALGTKDELRQDPTAVGSEVKMEGQPSFVLPCNKSQGKMAIKDAEGAAQDAAVNIAKSETVDSVLDEFQALCTEFTARSQSVMGLEAAEKGDMEEAVQHLHSSCMLGNVSACFNLGLCYETGSGVLQNFDQAKHYYKKAAESGHTLALYNLGLMYLSDTQVDAQPLSDNPSAISQDKIEGLKLLERAAKGGLVEAQTYMGIHHMEETGDVEKAIHYFRAAADQSDCEAQYLLAMCHEQGWGVAVNECRAAQLYSQAAGAGHELATFNLAVFSEYGLGGLPEDLISAKELYKKAADLGNEEAKQKLEEITIKEKVCRWKEKLSNFQDLYQLYHKEESTKSPNHHQDNSPLSPSISSPNLTQFLHKGLSCFFCSKNQGTDKSLQNNLYKVSFDPGGSKVSFHLGDGDKDGDDEMFAGRSSCKESLESGSKDEAPLHVPSFHKSNTTPNLAMVTCN